MSHNPIHPTQQAWVDAIAKQTKENNENKTIVVSRPLNVTARLGVDSDPDATYAPWPKRFTVIDSIAFITYEQVLAAFTDEVAFYQLQGVVNITGENQRYMGPVVDPDTNKEVEAICITLPGIASADVMLALYTQVQTAGHVMLPAQRHGVSGNTFTLFTVIPNYGIV
jgi:hypothetical protein